MIAGDFEEARALCDMYAVDAGARAADYIYRRTAKIVRQRQVKALNLAGRMIRNHAEARHWEPAAIYVLGAMLLYGWQTGRCCAGQRQIGAAAGLSRQQTNTWVGRLREAGLIELEGFDWRGTKETEGGSITRWCLVFLVDAAKRMAFAALRPASGRMRDSVKSRSKQDRSRAKTEAAGPAPRNKAPPTGIRMLQYQFPKASEYHWPDTQKQAQSLHYDEVVGASL